MSKELKYPVIAIPRNDNMVYVYLREKDLKLTSEELLSKLDYRNIELIDSSGHKYRIKKAFKVKYLALWGFNPLLKGRQILIDFDYDPDVEQVSLSDFKKNVINRVDKTKHIWQSGWEISELKGAVADSTSFEEIAYLLK